MLFTIWQRYRDTTPISSREGWGLWVATSYQDLDEAEAERRLAEIQADELGRRERYPGTEAEYEIRPSTRQPAGA